MAVDQVLVDRLGIPPLAKRQFDEVEMGLAGAARGTASGQWRRLRVGRHRWPVLGGPGRGSGGGVGGHLVGRFLPSCVCQVLQFRLGQSSRFGLRTSRESCSRRSRPSHVLVGRNGAQPARARLLLARRSEPLPASTVLAFTSIDGRLRREYDRRDSRWWALSSPPRGCRGGREERVSKGKETVGFRSLWALPQRIPLLDELTSRIQAAEAISRRCSFNCSFSTSISR
jgi:hypothetical protein